MGFQIQAQVALSDENYIHTIVPQVALTIAEINNVDCSTISAVDDAIESVTYFDGLGRPIQQRAIKASPQGKDIVTHIQYDSYGRQDKQYLPFASNASSGSLQAVDVDQDINTYYLDIYADDFPGITNPAAVNAYSESVFENSPLNRVLEQGAPGKAWKANASNDTDHTIKFDWNTNDANEVFYFKVIFTGGNTEKPELVKENHYLPNELYVTVTKDENWSPADGNNHTTKEYKNKSGQVVLKRTYNANVAHDTYYVYDDFGNLTFVIPPKVTTDDDVSAIELKELCYQYRYDHRNRLIEKKIPGKDWEYIIYNRLDQPVLTQDANLRAKRRWLFTKYDAFGRVAYTGIIENGSTVALLRKKTGGTSYATYESRSTAPITIAGATMYYTNDSYPVRMYKILTVNYYDDYNIGDLVTLNPETTTITWEGMTATAEVKGLPTVSQVRVLDTNKWITTTIYYDEKGRPWETIVKNEYLGTDDYVLNKLDFVGKVLKSHTVHIKGGATITTVDNFTYDHMGRLLNQTQKINNQEEERIASNAYDEIGQLTKKNVGGTVTTSGVEGLQTVDYAYNIRGWLKGINDVTTLGNDLFAFGINYNTTTESLGATALYNGNISETLWKTANDNTKRAYGYQYDALNRIIAGRSTSSNYNLSNVSYDKVGNIESLNRNGHLDINATSFGEMDQLIYDYDSGNKLLKVTDAANQNFGFKDGTNTNDDFEYDANGNMILDKNKGITNITYNHLNLPKTVAISNSEGAGTISYIYDATGAKLKKTVPSGSSLITTEYAGNYVYRNGQLQYLSTSEGYAEPNNSNGFDYVYQYVDHLGNIRLSYKDVNGNGSIAQDEIIEENNYYPFGLKHKGYNEIVSPHTNGTAQQFKYNGIELEESLGLDLYEMEFRQYDPAIARFTSIDPVTHHNFSTYTAFDNNPVYWADPSGANAESFINDLWNQSGDGKTTWTNNDDGTFSSDDGQTAECDDCDDKKKPKAMADAGSFYAQAYRNGNASRVALENGGDPMNPTESDFAEAEKQRNTAAGELVMFVVGEWAFAKVLQGGSYVYKFVRFKSVFNSTMRSSVKDKLARYLLNLDHAVGGSKAKFFKDALGFTLDNADDLAKQIVFNNKKAIATEVTKYGTKYSQNIAIKGANGRVIDVTFAWIKNKDGLVKLVTGFPAK
ncbi:hypothetical protein AWE51_19545 [Aquimarina aggregata]|uniref:Uncharacterized protein n=1 Tax=Aquimarina aggregata TaxID=1642818 RepID=A0A162WQ70_9FLAO|nr:DUF6443 domain-containing protein [Aquimarina aggregata]KZS38233.1 hypothetical protein AWE51_19545 [Aquimarina aggregata]